MEQDNIELSVLVIDYLKSERVIESYNRLLDLNLPFSFEFLVLDNSQDGNNYSKLLEIEGEFCKVYSLNANVGYTKGMNFLAKHAKGKTLLVLNPDILIKSKESITKCLELLSSDSTAGIVAPHQINDDGTYPSVARKYPSIIQLILKRTLYKLGLFTGFVESYTDSYDINQNAVSVDWLQSSCFFIEQKIYKEVGGFNEKYFLFMADIEICHEVRKLGYKSIYLKTECVIADGKRASEGGFFSLFRNRVLRMHVIDAMKYYFGK